MSAPLEIYEETSYEIYDPQNARVVAVFTDETEARAYLYWRNYQRAMEGYRADGYVP